MELHYWFGSVHVGSKYFRCRSARNRTESAVRPECHQLVLPPASASPATKQHPITVENAQQVRGVQVRKAGLRKTSLRRYSKNAQEALLETLTNQKVQKARSIIESKKQERGLPIDAARASAQLRKKHEKHGTAPDAGEGLSLLHHFSVWLVQTNTQGERKYTSTNINRLELLATTRTSPAAGLEGTYLPYIRAGIQAGTWYLLVCFIEETKEAISCANVLMVYTYLWLMLSSLFHCSRLAACVGSHAGTLNFPMPAILARVIYSKHTWNRLVGAQ